MSWLFSQAMVAEYSAGTCLDGEPSAQLNVMPTPHKFWRNDKTMEFCDLSRFGLTLQLLTADHGEALLTSYLAAFRAKTSVQPEKVQESPAQDQACGKKWHGLLARYDQDSCLWKTAQCSLLADLELSLETWPRSGSMRNGECYLQPMLERLTCAKESGLWLTPRASDTGKGEDQETFLKRMGDRSDRCAQSLAAQVRNPKTWPTPTTCGNYNRPGASKTSGLGLALAVKMWPTPTASASKGSSPASLTRKSGKSRVNDRLDHSVMATNGGQLNPAWVEWLMGWPIGWTDLKALEMDKFRQWQQQHLSCLGQGLSEAA